VHSAVRTLVAIALATASIICGSTTTSHAATLPALDDSSSPFWLATSQGDVWNFGSAANHGTLKGQPLNRPIVGITPTPDGGGYWLVAGDGGVFAFGNASFLGSTGNLRLNQPIVGMTPTPTNKGYWMVASDGGIFAYGDAKFFGSTGSIPLNRPIVGMAAAPDNMGYWLVASDGGIFAFGSAKFFGSTGALTLNRPIVAMAPTPGGQGYWLVASDGGIFAYGDAKFFGSTGGGSDASYQRIVATPDGAGYWLVRNGGDAVAFGSADVAASGKKTTKRGATATMFHVSTPGDKAVLFAMSQLGKDYVWGGNGPNGYDCSGLTSQAWKSAGTIIPRIANDQYDFGTHVSLDSLRPGDLLFWSTDLADKRAINHVGMYVGGGWGVNSGGTGTGVNVRSIPRTSGWMMDLGVRPR
jgi:cell wall-associated NlpC family hydrolase